ncbi:hypothetical protein ACPEH7_16395 [Stenotrophomonas sp. NPDC101269]|uniref:hypothetical protein n=1 Tax=Stenotrophomonas TaxID=40323 RepID=UPI0012917858|nr:hypothetical protein [Stenotrophomonas nematodicola]
MKRLILPLLAMWMLCGFTPVAPFPDDAGPVSLQVVDRDSGRTLRQYPDGSQRWIAGQQGHRYSVALRNDSNERVLVVLSVDGLNAITGEVAAPGQTGYVLDPWQRAEISGWRKSSREVAQFVFSDPGRSYAARTGRPDNIGVIGIAVFREAARYAPAPPIARPSRPILREAPQAEAAADVASARGAAAPAPQLGTGHGAREYSRADNTTFDRATRMPTQRLDVRYDSERNLIARGVMPRRALRRDDAPQSFPQGYVPDPPSYRGR